MADIFPSSGIHESFLGMFFGFGPPWSLAAICTNPEINKWSRYKPVRYSWPVASMNISKPSDWWKANDRRCGLAFNTYDSPGSLSIPGSFLYQLVNNLDVWTYDRPSGGSVSPYRKSDFFGYNHDAILPVGPPPTSIFYVENNQVTIPFEATVAPNDPHNLTLADIEVNGIPLSQYYMGGMLYQKGSSSYIVSTTSTPIGNGHPTLVMRGLSDSYAGTWALYPFLSKAAFSGSGSLPVSTFICFPLRKNISVVIKESGTQVQIFAMGVYLNPGRTTVQYFVTIFNELSRDITLTNVKVTPMRTRGSGNPSAGEVVGAAENFGSISIASKSEINLGPYELSVTYQSGYQYWLAARADDTDSLKISTTYTPIEDLPPES